MAAVAKPKSTDNVVTLHKQVANAKYKLNRTILRHPQTTKSDAIVADYLISRYNPEKGYAWPPLDKMVEVLKLSKPTIIKATRHLEELGFFRINRADRPGRGLSNEYVPNFQEIHPGKGDSRVYPLESEKGKENCPKRVKPETEKGSSRLYSIVDSQEEPSSSFLSTDRKDIKPSAPNGADAGYAEKSSPERKGGRIGWSRVSIPREVTASVNRLGRISSWGEFDQKVLENTKVLYHFYTSDISPRYFRCSVDRFRDIIIKKVKWLDVDDACKALIHWLEREQVRGGSERGESWGGDYE